MSFTKAGERTALRIAESLAGDPDFMVRSHRVKSLKKFVTPIFERNNILVFIGAVGIAVRAVARLLNSKTTDPPVLVVDEAGCFAIPILSGHIGGANRLARKIAEKIGAIPVITTATDLQGVFAIDTFAAENGYTILNPEMIKTVSSRLLAEKVIGLSTDFEIVGLLPKNVRTRNRGKVGVYIGFEADKSPFERTLHLIPRCYHVGIGTRKGISSDTVSAFYSDTIKALSIPFESVADISSIDLKRDETAIVLLAERHGIPFRTYGQDQLRKYEKEFDSSEFVRSKTGVGNVCEIAAWLSANQGELVLKKTTRSGITLAVAKEHWIIDFNLSKRKTEGATE